MSERCPICKGTGKLPKPRKVVRDRQEERRSMAKTLRDAGYSMRQIQDFLGWKSVRSVSYALSRSDS
jgi:DNA-binding transcriptional MerR regulator